MKFKNTIAIALAGLLLTTISYGQSPKNLKDYLGVPGPITFTKSVYHLAWSSHPSANYCKQEYLAKTDNIEKFKRLILLEVLSGNANVKEIVASKVSELKAMKASNPMVNYDMFEKGGEVMLDFLVSQNSADGKTVSILERNVYRYKSGIDKNGQNYLLLFAVSERAYGNEVDKFLVGLKSRKLDLLNAVSSFVIPEIKIAK